MNTQGPQIVKTVSKKVKTKKTDEQLGMNKGIACRGVIQATVLTSLGLMLPKSCILTPNVKGSLKRAILLLWNC